MVDRKVVKRIRSLLHQPCQFPQQNVPVQTGVCAGCGEQLLEELEFVEEPCPQL